MSIQTDIKGHSFKIWNALKLHTHDKRLLKSAFLINYILLMIVKTKLSG